jgi:AcrR family transcriptional regulator
VAAERRPGAGASAVRSRGAGRVDANVPRSGAAGDATHQQLAQIQRSRLVASATRVVDELGYANATVAHITDRARISRRTFYELFSNREQCLAAVLDSILGLIEGELAAAEFAGRPWRERISGGLSAILGFFDREPVLARVCVVEALHGGPAVLERRERVLARLAAVVDEGRRERARGEERGPLTAEGLVGATLAIVHARLLRRDRKPLVGLHGELTAMIVLPYLGAAAARREQGRSVPVRAKRATSDAGQGAHTVDSDPLAGLSMRLTYRTARVLQCVAEHPRTSNRGLAELAGIADQGQVSKLLARLHGLGLLANAGEGHTRGEANAWVLTAVGRQVTESIHFHTRTERRAA